MKQKILTLFTASMMMVAIASAQSMKLGVKVGATTYKLDGVSFSDEFKWGYHIGGTAELMFSPTFGIQPEVLFNQSNTQTGYTFDTLYQSINPGMLKDVQLNYLSIPVLLNWRPSPFITFQAGPQFSILMSKERSLLKDGQEAFKNGGVSILGGVQLNILAFRVYGRYGVGLTNLNNIENNSDKWKSRGFQFGAAVMF